MLVPDPDKALQEQDEVVLLAILGWGEARGEPDDGLAAVLHTVLERARIKKTELKDQILRHVTYIRKDGKPYSIYQYSCFNSEDPNLRKLWRPLKYGAVADWERCLNAATSALQGSLVNPAVGATHYCTRRLWMCPVAAKPKWHDLVEVASGRTKKIATVGGHVFARTRF